MISPNEQSTVISKAYQEGFITGEDTTVLFYSLAKLKDKLHGANSFFTEYTPLHTAAVKTNPVARILKEIVGEGHGLEAASLTEVKMALNAGCSKSKIVFDSPAKTQHEINWCVQNLKGATVNANCLEELYRYPENSGLNLGLRINVQKPSGSAGFLEVSNETSKFGEPISNVDGISKAVRDYPDLNTLHIHQGSQNKNIEGLLHGIREVVELAQKINGSLNRRQIEVIDIGGGFAVNYEGDGEWNIEELYAPLEAFWAARAGEFRIITEPGRYYHAHSGFVASKCEYVLARGNSRVVITHAGAELFLRECYVPASRPKTFHLLSSGFEFKGSSHGSDQNGCELYDIAGPLCFGGDFTARRVLLPPVEEGDFLIYNDAGANTMGLWSMHCSRPAPAVVLYDLQRDYMEVIKKRQTAEDVMKFWELA